MINSINYQGHIGSYQVQQSGYSLNASRSEQKNTLIESLLLKSDTVNLESSSETNTTTNATYTNSLAAGGKEADSFEVLRGLVLNMLKEQGINTKAADGSTQVDLGTITQQDAQKLIAEDGYFGVAQTSDRIVNLAIASAGGDPAKIDAIKAGVDNGYQEALKAFGGTLPDISHDTYDAVMNKLDAWAQTANDSQVTQPTG